jgi:hypothetical protein
MKFSELKIGQQFTFVGGAWVFQKVSPKSYAEGGKAIVKCKGSGRYFNSRNNPDPAVIEVAK